jgi:hypothetical protein
LADKDEAQAAGGFGQKKQAFLLIKPVFDAVEEKEESDEEGIEERAKEYDPLAEFR